MMSFAEINALEREEKWPEAILALEQRVDQTPSDVKARIWLIFLLWYVLLESDHQKHGVSADSLEEKLRSQFTASRGLYSDDPEYLFFIGYIIQLSEWYFEDNSFPDAARQAREMIKSARSLDPQNLLYEWGYHMAVSHDFEKSRGLGRELIKDARFNALSDQGALGAYFREMIESSGGN